MKSKRYRTSFSLYPFYRTCRLTFPRASFAQAWCPSHRHIWIFLRISEHVLQLLVLIFQLLYPLIFLSHCGCLTIILSNKALVSVVDLISFPRLVSYLLNFLPETTQLIAFIYYDFPLSLVSCHYLAKLLEAQLCQG